jgi:hypothetical protein
VNATEELCEPLPAPLCSHCGFTLPKHIGGLRHYGTHTAHQEWECLRLLHAEIARLREEMSCVVQALPEPLRGMVPAVAVATIAAGWRE